MPQALAITPDQVRLAAQWLVRPEQMTWLVAGDLSRTEAPIRAPNRGEVYILDSNGTVQR